jgi:hypothetical protein
MPEWQRPIQHHDRMVTTSTIHGMASFSTGTKRPLINEGAPAQPGQHFTAYSSSMLSRLPGSRQQRRSDAPVLVLPNGQFEMTAHIGVVLNRVYAQHKHHPEVSRVFGGPDARLVVAYTCCPSHSIC